jgi:hypothetical protein
MSGNRRMDVMGGSAAALRAFCELCRRAGGMSECTQDRLSDRSVHHPHGDQIRMRGQ